MNKIYLSIIGLSISIATFGQSEAIQIPTKFQEIQIKKRSLSTASSNSETIIWEEDFANGLEGNNSSDSSWSISGPDGAIWQHDLDGSDGQYWGDREPIESESSENGWMIFDADGSNTPGSPSSFVMREGQLVSPTIDLSNHPNVSLSFTQYFRWCCYDSHQIGVDVSTDGGATWNSNFSTKGEFLTNQDSETHIFTINITPIAGGQDSVKFRFNWDGSETASHYFWMIDDVKLTTPPENFIMMFENNFGGWFTTPIEEGLALDYTFIPIDQASNNPYKFEGIISNEGLETQENVTLHAEIYDENEYLLSSETSLGVTIDALQFGDAPLAARDTFVTTYYTPTNTGELRFDFFASSEDTISNTSSSWSVVTTNEYGRDADNPGYSRNMITNGIGSLEVGNLFDMYTDQDIYGIKTYLHPDYSQVGSDLFVYGVIYEIEPTSGDRIWLSQSDYIEVSSEDDLGWSEIIFNDPVPLFAGSQYLVCLGGLSNGSDTLYVANSGFSPDYTSYLNDIDGSTNNQTLNTWYYTTRTPIVRALMGTPPANIENISFEFHISPNPNNGIFTINSSENISLITVKDMLGKVVFQNNGTNSTIDLSKLDKGSYLISLENNKGIISSQKLIIQ